MERETASGGTWGKWFGGAALGALAMYLADPERGKRRRALARDKITSLSSKTVEAMDVASRDFSNRMQGMRAQAGRMLSRRNREIDDSVLTARVRAKIGRAIAHPHPVHVFARHGRIVLSGPVLAQEKEQLLDAVRHVPGVAEVDDNLQVHEGAEGVPSLQGQGRSIQSRPAIMQQHWPPSLRAAAILAGGALAGYYGFARRGPASILGVAAGLGIMTRGAINAPFMRMPGAIGAQKTIDLHKTIYIDAAPETVFDIWSRYENFPRFMSNVLDIRDLGNGRSHWVVSGPGGTRVEWNAMMMESIRPHVLAWHSEPDSDVQHAGQVRFERAGTGTRAIVQMSFTPLAGMLGRAAVSLFNGDPERQMEQDLMRMKTFIESNRTPADVIQPVVQPGTPLH